MNTRRNSDSHNRHGAPANVPNEKERRTIVSSRKRTGPQRFAIYLRCSSDDQKHGDYTTIDTQRELNRKRVAERGTFIREYSDEGRSGTNLNRPGWKELLAD